MSPPPPSPPPSLAELQQRLFALITSRGRVSDALVQQALPPTHVTDVIHGDDKLDAIGRLDIYNGMYYFRLLEDVLEADYPAVHAILGKAEFERLVGEYLVHHPPSAPSLRHASAKLPAYLEAQGKHLQLPSWLADLAALECARVDVFDEADNDLLTLPMLQAAGADLPKLDLRSIHAHRLVPVHHKVEDVWRAVDEGRAPPVPEEGPGLLLIWRQDNVVYHRAAGVVEWPLLRRLATGVRFEVLCEQLGEQRDEAQAAQVAIELLLRWVRDGLLTRP